MKTERIWCSWCSDEILPGAMIVDEILYDHGNWDENGDPEVDEILIGHRDCAPDLDTQDRPACAFTQTF